MSDERPGYGVGYKRPPTHARFKVGQSGNPKGRPKGTQNLATDLQEELAERIPIREGERNLHVSKQRALLKGLLAKALKGDSRAAGLVLQLVARFIVPEEKPGFDETAGLDPEDLAILERYVVGRGTSQ